MQLTPLSPIDSDLDRLHCDRAGARRFFKLGRVQGEEWLSFDETVLEMGFTSAPTPVGLWPYALSESGGLTRLTGRAHPGVSQE